MADPDILGVPRNQVNLGADPALLTADEIAMLSQPEIDAAIAAAPTPEFRAEIERAVAGRRAQMATEALTQNPNVMPATSAIPGRRPAEALPVAAAAPQDLALATEAAPPASVLPVDPHTDYMRGVLAGRRYDASGSMPATEAVPANVSPGAPVVAATPQNLEAPAPVVGNPHEDYQRAFGSLAAGQRFDPQEMMRLTQEEVDARRRQAAKPIEQQGAEAFPIGMGGQAQGEAAGPAASTAENTRLDLAIEAEQRFKDAIDAYKGIYKGWDGSPEKAPNPALKSLAEAAIKASVERQAALAEKHGQEQEAITKQIAEVQKQSSDYSMDYSKAAEQAAVERDRNAQEYESMIRKAQADLEQETKNLDPHRMVRGGRGLLLALFSGMGAFGASYNRTPNWAGQYIDDALDKDFQAQKDRVNIRSGQISKAMELYNMFRLRGMEDAAAKAAVHALVKDYYAGRIASLATTKQGMVERQASQSVASGLREQAEIARNTAILESAAGVPGKVTDIVKLAQEAVQRGYSIEKTQAEIKKLEAEAAAAKEPKKGYTAGIRAKVATEYATRSQTIKNIEEMIDLVKTGRTGPIGSRLAFTDDGKRFDVLRRTSLEALARSFGAATTGSDRKAASDIEQGWVPQFTPGQMLGRLNALLISARNQRNNVLAGQDPDMVHEIIKDYMDFQNNVTQGVTQSTENYAKVAGGHL